MINQPDTILNKGDAAPFYGVMVSPKKYKIYTIDHEEKNQILDNLDKKLKPDPTPMTDQGLGGLTWFLMGSVFTLGTMAAFHH